MPSSAVTALLVTLGALALLSAAFLAYIWFKYGPIIGRIFEEFPVFRPLRTDPLVGGEEVRFPTADGLSLAGTYLSARTPQRAGVVVFCHEFLGDRASAATYADSVRDLGFDLFAFDFRNHGDSDTEPNYKPLQWVSNRETRDLKAALAYLRKRPDADPAGVGLFGVSRGGSTAICVAAREPRVWGVVTDGAFPTRGTMLAYIFRWAEIYVSNPTFWKFMPRWLFEFASWSGRVRTEWRLGRKFPDVERAASRLAPRPLMMVHGERDNYIGPQIARDLFARAREPKEFWLIPGAKHNRCLEVDPTAYRARVDSFFHRFAPRRPTSPRLDAAEDKDATVGPFVVPS